MRFIIAIVLVALLTMLQYHLWWQGTGVVTQNNSLQETLEQEKEKTKRLDARNARLQAEIQDLKESTEVIEELARHDLKMIKDDEVLIQFR